VATAIDSAARLSDPPALLAIARAAQLTGNRELATRRLLREQHGIEVSFRPAPTGSRREAECER
jgi:hypothetical protein